MVSGPMANLPPTYTCQLNVRLTYSHNDSFFVIQEKNKKTGCT